MNYQKLQELINQLNQIYIELEDLIGTSETDDLEIYIQGLEKMVEEAR